MIFVEGRVLKREQITGVERYALEICQHLSEITKIKILMPKTTNNILSHLWVQTVLPLRTCISSPSVLFCPVMDAPVFLSRYIKLVVTIHDLSFIRYPDMYSKSFRGYYSKVLPFVIRRADNIICISENERKYIEETYPEATGKTTVIYHGISKKFFNPGLPRQKVILTVASFNKHKNLTRLLRAYENIQEKIPHKIVLVGGARPIISSDKEAELIIKRLENSGRLVRTGYIGDGELQRLYQTSEIFAFPSLFEGFGFPPLEAMACGCAVCCSDASCMPEICSDAADYFNPYSEDSIAESLVRVALGDGYRDTLILKGESRSKEFTWEKTSISTLSLLLE